MENLEFGGREDQFVPRNKNDLPSERKNMWPLSAGGPYGPPSPPPNHVLPALGDETLCMPCIRFDEPLPYLLYLVGSYVDDGNLRS